MANIWSIKPDVSWSVTAGVNRLSLQKRQKYLFYINTADIPDYYNFNGNGVEFEGVYKNPELGIKYIVCPPAFIFCLDYP